MSALALTLLNLPFAFAFFRAFQMDEAKRRNHVLEHATILHLEQTSGRRFSGRAAGNGFRVAGRASIADVRRAFERIRRTVQAGEPLSYVSRRCGSNVVTTQGFGLLALLRGRVGNALQRRHFMLADFHEVSVRDVRFVKPELLERGPGHFVETLVRVRSE